MKLKLKYKRENVKEYAHTEVYMGEKYLGYFLPNKSILARKGENWNFVSKCDEICSFYSSNRSNIIKHLNYELLKNTKL